MKRQEILVIDDEALVRASLKATLEMAGYRVQVAADGVQAGRLMARWRPDLVITDILMPEREGIEVIRDIAERYPALPVLAISGGGRNGHLEFLEIAARLGATATLAKPFGAASLLEEVRRLLEAQRSKLHAAS